MNLEKFLRINFDLKGIFSVYEKIKNPEIKKYLTTYMETLVESSPLSGGYIQNNYYLKYQKYKNKYLNLYKHSNKIYN